MEILHLGIILGFRFQTKSIRLIAWGYFVGVEFTKDIYSPAKVFIHEAISDRVAAR